MNRQQLQPIVDAIGAHSEHPSIVAATIWEALKSDSVKPGWRCNMLKLALFCEQLAEDISEPAFTIISEGNSKLPFLSFSAMPGFAFCPGSGDCREWCYSFSAWRYPAAFCRQAQNTLLLSSDAGRASIKIALNTQLRRPKYQKLDHVDFRLYVDGDFRSVDDITFWMSLIGSNPKLATYGYSKSFREFLDYDNALDRRGATWPTNYVLNVSSGHRHTPGTVRAIEALPVTRGRFVAVAMPKKARSTDHGNRDHQKEVRDHYGKAAFTCPGSCGTCTPSGHACGSQRFKNVDIIIAAH